LIAGLIVRLASVFFSAGYVFHDDHFEVIELAQKWRDGIPFAWSGEQVHVFSLLYPGIHYLLFEACELLGVRNPPDIMLIVRLFHALVSLLGIYYAYLLTLRLSNHKPTAIIGGLFLSLFWMFPFLSVHSLREFFCVPFLLAATFFAVDPKLTSRSVLLSAFFFVLAFTIRLQIIYIPAGIGLYWIVSKQHYKTALQFGAAFFVFFMLTQGVFDLIYYGNPLASTLQYLRYNSNPENIAGYPQGPWYQYLGTLALICLGLPLLPLLWGYIRCARLSNTLRMLFFASLLFFIFHSWYSNKQERFLLPFVPYFLILGIIGFSDYYRKHKNERWLIVTTWILAGWLIIVNSVALVIASFTYSKRARVESMNWLRRQGDVTNIIVEGIDTPPPLPLFYLGKRVSWYELNSLLSPNDLQKEIRNGKKPVPNYLIMSGSKHLQERLARLSVIFPTLRHVTDIEPGFIDNILYQLNPAHNKNETWHIYRID
jgi:hypothetical protein